MGSPGVLFYRRLVGPPLGWVLALLRWACERLGRLIAWHIDIVSASYYASEFPYSEINPEDDTVLSLVVKTRGGQQYYQSALTMSWSLSIDDMRNGARAMENSCHELSLVEAEGRNRALSVQRKAYSLALLLITGVVLELVFDVNISILT